MKPLVIAVFAAVLYGGPLLAAGMSPAAAPFQEFATYLSNVVGGGLTLMFIAHHAARLLRPRKRKRLGEPESSTSPGRHAPTFRDRSDASSGRGRHVGSTNSR